jgi:hypothetical protein
MAREGMLVMMRRRRRRAARDPGLDKGSLQRQINADLRRKERAQIEALKIALRHARARGSRAEVSRLYAELLAAQKHRRELRSIARSARQRSKGERKASVGVVRERQGESDDVVRENIPPELVPLFDRVRRSIKVLRG